MAKTNEVVQNVYKDFVSSVHKKVYGMTVNGTTLLTTNHALYKNAVISAELQKAQYVQQHGKDSDYKIATYDRLHIATERQGYLGFAQQANCALLYKEGQAEHFENPDHATIIMTKTPEEQVDYIDSVLDTHCATYNIDLNRGFSYSEVPFVDVTGAYKNEEMPPVSAHTRSGLMGLKTSLTQSSLYEFVHGDPASDITPEE